MEKIKLLIADADAEFIRKAEITLQAHPDIEIAEICTDGSTAFEYVQKHHPDVVLFDLVLPSLDGISLLRGIMSLKNPPLAICCTQFYSTVALEAARKYGAAYFLFKPIEFRTLYETIKGCLMTQRQIQLAQKESSDFRNAGTLEIRNYLVSLGIPSKLVGCAYLAEAVRLAFKDISLVQNLSKGLYLEISRIMDTSPSCVERCIRNAISSAYQNGRLGERMVTCPSNKEFINYALRNLEN